MNQSPKRFLLVVVSLMFLPIAAQAAFNLPKYVYHIAQLKEAQQKAVDEKRVLVFLYSDKATTCPLCTDASNDILYSFDKEAVIVYAEHKDWGLLPPLVQNALRAPEAGEFIPITIVTDCQAKEVISYIPYERHNRLVLIKNAKEKIKEYSGRQ